VSDDPFADSLIDLGCQYPLIEQIQLCAVGPETNDSCGPGRGDARYFFKLLQARSIDVNGLRRFLCVRGPHSWGRSQKYHAQGDLEPGAHLAILRLSVREYERRN